MKLTKLTPVNEDRYQALFLASRDAVMTLEPPPWKFTSGNPATLKMFKAKSEEEFLKHDPWELSPKLQPDGKDSQKKAIEMINIAMDKGYNFFEWTHRRINGQDFPAEVLLSRVKDKGKIFLHAVVRDITDRKNIDKKLKEYQEEKFKVVFDNATDGLALINASTQKISLSNKAFCKILGYSSAELKKLSILNIYPKEELPHVLEQFEKIKKNEISLIENIPVKKKDGSIFYADINGSSIMIDGEKFVLGSFRDITRRKKDEEHIKELSEVRNKFISIVSHQLRTPITVVNWNLAMILGGDFGKLSDVQRKFLQSTYTASLKVISRIGDLIAAMDIEEGRINFIREEVFIDNICSAVMKDMLIACDIKDLSCAYQPSPKEVPTIEGDGAKIRMVITSLMENAVEYTNKGGKVVASLKIKKNSIRFEVTDTGVGIPSAEKHRVFTRFFRASNASTMQPDAFGLGLYVAKNFIEQHGGHIGFESKEGVGSKFWFEIPIKSNSPS